RIAGAALLQHALAPGQAIQQQIHERHEARRHRQVGPAGVQPAAQQHDVATADDPWRSSYRRENAGPATAAGLKGVPAENSMAAKSGTAVGELRRDRELAIAPSNPPLSK